MSEVKHSPALGPDHPISKIPRILPHERVFPIQIGSELFKLSGASISSDAPSYFSQYFQCQIKRAEERGEDISNAIRTLYIDRDPVTFQDISLHLQGYHVCPRDGTHFLYDESIFMSIGHREFQIPRDLFTDSGNSPNFFSLGFAIFFSSPEDLFPGLDREGLIRPPSILPPSVPNRSAETFAEILHLLRGYPADIRNEAHRASLLRDCRYFNFKGLEQKLIPHHISFNQMRKREEIVIKVEDILKSGITVLPEPTSTDPNAAWVNYARPYVDDKAYELVLEIGGENTKLNFSHPSANNASLGPNSGQQQQGGGTGSRASPSFYTNSPVQSHVGLAGSSSGGGNPNFIAPTVLASGRAEFFRDSRARVSKLFEVISTKLNLPPRTQPLGLLMASGGAGSQPATPGNTPISDDLVRVVLEPETSITLDGKPFPAAQVFSAMSGGAQGVYVAPGTGGDEVSDIGTTSGATGYQNQHQQQVYAGTGNSPGQVQGHSTDSPPTAPIGMTTSGNMGAMNNMSMNMNMNMNPTQMMGAHTQYLNPTRKRRRMDVAPGGWKMPDEWVVKTGQWRLRIQGARGGRIGVECVLVAVKLEAFTSELARNSQRGFLNV